MRFRHAITSTLLALYLCQTTVGQIFSIRGNDILNAPYRGTIDSLRQATMDIGYGEVGTFVEPTSNSQIQAEPPILIWHDPTPGIDDPWDRSVLRLYNGWTHPATRSICRDIHLSAMRSSSPTRDTSACPSRRWADSVVEPSRRPRNFRSQVSACKPQRVSHRPTGQRKSYSSGLVLPLSGHNSD
jgi:hypothetical protein